MRAVLIVCGLASAARADVMMPEPTQLTCGRSEVIVAGIIEGTTTGGPFTNGSPPTVKITARECFAGCKPGDTLEVSEWVDSRPSHSGKPRPADPKAEQAAWERAAVVPPPKGTEALLFLRRDGSRLVRVQDSGGYGGFVMLVGAGGAAIEHMAAMCRFGVGFEGERDRSAALGRPTVVRFSATNTSRTTATYHADQIVLKLQTDTRPGEDIAPTWTPPRATVLAPGKALTVDWGLTKLFPGAFVKAGHYWLTLDAPGQLGLHWLSFEVK